MYIAGEVKVARPLRGKMTKESSNDKKKVNANSSDKDASPDSASKEWLKDYLRKVYGVKITGPKSLQKELSESGQHFASNIIVDEFAFRLLARFNDLDVAPCDGYISMAELQFAINSPRLYFDEKDKHMLEITRRYFHTIHDACQPENELDDPHEGLSRHDLEILSTSQSKACANLRKKLEQEFSAKEPA